MTLLRNRPSVGAMDSRCAFVLIFLAITIAAGLSPASGADPVQLTVAPRILSAVDQDTMLVIIPPRPEGEIRADKRAAEQLRADEDGMLSQAVDRYAVADATLELKKQEIETLKARINLAEEQGQEMEKRLLESRVQVEGLRLDLMEKTADVRSAEKELIESARAAAAALIRYYDIELELAAMRSTGAPESRAAQDAAAIERRLRYERDLLELERRGMEALLLQIEKREEVLKKEQRLLDRRVELFEAQNVARSGRTR